MRGVTKKPPIFVPAGEPRHAIMALSKAALADIAWNLAALVSGEADCPSAVFQAFTQEAGITLPQRGDQIPDALRGEN